MRRPFPFWVALLPLALGVLAWFLIWRGYADGLRTELRDLLPPGAKVEISGFPYRLEARVDKITLGHDGGSLQAKLDARELFLNRVPWQRDRQVLVAFDPEMRVSVPGLHGADLLVSATAAKASLHTDGKRIERLSIVWPSSAEIATGLLPVAVRAAEFELHVRETPAATEGAPVDDQPNTKAQIVLSGLGLRFGEGAPLKLALDAGIDSLSSLSSLASWREGGAIKIADAVLSDEVGEVARFRGTIRAAGPSGLFLSGEIDTLCPATVRAAVAGTSAAPEKRARRIQTLSISGSFPGGLSIPPRDESRPLPPVRGQEADCPLLR